jgi:hypothetical protein
LGCRVTSVELLHGDPVVRGQCGHVASGDLFKEAVIGIAGALATAAVWPDEGGYSKTDVHEMMQLSPDSQSKAVALASDLLTQRWHRVQELADQLVIHDRLTDQDALLNLLLESIPPRPTPIPESISEGSLKCSLLKCSFSCRGA